MSYSDVSESVSQSAGEDKLLPRELYLRLWPFGTGGKNRQRTNPLPSHASISIIGFNQHQYLPLTHLPFMDVAALALADAPPYQSQQLIPIHDHPPPLVPVQWPIGEAGKARNNRHTIQGLMGPTVEDSCSYKCTHSFPRTSAAPRALYPPDIDIFLTDPPPPPVQKPYCLRHPCLAHN
ncbi:hypothetical protein BO82DRAFT_27917 [Aspergillus uvarum CBS 121591]|uniref:Uncharacterized protein n=1 Tax=Aspergillus uvarum CBS 121591 TaxID=1448315 RepID=A0A319BV61_9EURO|nr:hypothetical protein BO82DRAFT_27917 [Aspergillus uvarum CBS 121591]PYH75429.1 hypothetical protein BO82DRAFT_27917 [Aspergillus uvarum CBS 121591]